VVPVLRTTFDVAAPVCVYRPAGHRQRCLFCLSKNPTALTQQILPGTRVCRPIESPASRKTPCKARVWMSQLYPRYEVSGWSSHLVSRGLGLTMRSWIRQQVWDFALADGGRLQRSVKIVNLTLEPGASVALVVRVHGLNANQVFKWRRAFERSPLLEKRRQ
jgi:hypothetical protein